MDNKTKYVLNDDGSITTGRTRLFIDNALDALEDIVAEKE